MTIFELMIKAEETFGHIDSLEIRNFKDFNAGGHDVETIYDGPADDVTRVIMKMKMSDKDIWNISNSCGSLGIQVSFFN